MGAAPALHLRGDFLESLREIWSGAENLTAGAAVPMSCSSLCSSSRAGHWDVLAVGCGCLGSSSMDSTKQASASPNLVP